MKRFMISLFAALIIAGPAYSQVHDHGDKPGQAPGKMPQISMCQMKMQMTKDMLSIQKRMLGDLSSEERRTLAGEIDGMIDKLGKMTAQMERMKMACPMMQAPGAPEKGIQKEGAGGADTHKH